MLSIIIPVYNTEKYLKKCIDSILAQTYIHLELILVDDGSKDMSSSICDEYASKEMRIRVVHKVNGGVSSARNSGLDVCQGEYVMFVDSDDWLEPDFCKELMCQAERADLVAGGYTMIDKSGKSEYAFKNQTIHFPEQMGKNFDELYKNNFFNTPFSKVYRRERIGKQRFCVSVALGEDFLFNLEYLEKCSIIKTMDAVGYIYNCLNAGAATKKLRENDIEQAVALYRAGKEFLHTYCQDVLESRTLNERLCLSGINLIQLVCYSDKTRVEKRNLAERMLRNGDFIRVCQQEYDLPFKYDFPRKLCVRGNWRALQVFFWIKRGLSYVKSVR